MKWIGNENAYDYENSSYEEKEKAREAAKREGRTPYVLPAWHSYCLCSPHYSSNPVVDDLFMNESDDGDFNVHVRSFDMYWNNKSYS